MSDFRYRMNVFFNCEYCGCRVRVEDTSIVFIPRFGKSLQVCDSCCGQLYIEDELGDK